ncbi:hypothetical protein V1389_02100 [Flavobacterium rakeshii]|uniref:hypothetical protein n=1 Tax=Flavobacterium rakeshii TaxID=1038845 RepID=UPI002E7B737C|nr:hypothetical protein [Flavobacterium rakeshii]MEE1897109.1 hypothetical protein [Flavobacterium rakeshii]
MRKIITVFYAMWIPLYVIKSMIKEADFFKGLNDFKDFLSAWKNQVNEFKNKL